MSEVEAEAVRLLRRVVDEWTPEHLDAVSGTKIGSEIRAYLSRIEPAPEPPAEEREGGGEEKCRHCGGPKRSSVHEDGSDPDHYFEPLDKWEEPPAEEPECIGCDEKYRTDCPRHGAWIKCPPAEEPYVESLRHDEDKGARTSDNEIPTEEPEAEEPRCRTTHHEGCVCHEERHAREIREKDEQLAKQGAEKLEINQALTAATHRAEEAEKLLKRWLARHTASWSEPYVINDTRAWLAGKGEE